MNGNRVDGEMGRNRKFGSKVVSSLFAILAGVLLLAAGVRPAAGQACPAQGWTSGANVWAAEGSIKVMLNNQPTSNEPTIPTYADDGYFNPWGYTGHPPMTQLNPVYSCPGGSPQITLAGAGRETVSFQVFITANTGAGAGLTGVTVDVSPLSGSGTLTSDNTQTSNVTRYLEGYLPYSTGGAASLQVSGNGYVPDVLVPFYDPYDSGTPALGTPFNVQPGTTQGVWVNISIPAVAPLGSQAVGTYTGYVTVQGNGVYAQIPITLTVWNGNLPRFDSPNHPDMLKSFVPSLDGRWYTRFMYGEGLPCDGPGCSQGQALFQKYQIMAHDYDFDTFSDIYQPHIAGAYPSDSSSGPSTSFTTGPPTGPGATGTTSTIDWTAWDAYYGPALTPGGLFADGTSLRVFDSPLGTGGNGPLYWCGLCDNNEFELWGWSDFNDPSAAPLLPANWLTLSQNYSEQVSQHFTQNQLPVGSGGKGWGHPELIAYNWDETFDKLYDSTVVYDNVALENQAINNANTAFSPTWAANTNPIHTFLTDDPACHREYAGPNNTPTPYTAAACAQHINLSYPGGPNSSGDPLTGSAFTNPWVIDWATSAALYMPGQPGPPLSYGTGANTAVLTANTGYAYTLDMTQGVPAQSTAPVPIEKWFYQGGEPNEANDSPANTGVGLRANFWIAYKYGLDQTTISQNSPNQNPAPAPGGVWDWAADAWGGYPGSCYPTDGEGATPYSGATPIGGGVLFYPGNQLTCFTLASPNDPAAAIESNILTQSVNPNGSNGISGPVASVRMEQWRRGYEDYMYLYLLGKQSGRSAAEAVVDTMSGGGMTAGTASGESGTSYTWNALEWMNFDPYWYAWTMPGTVGGFGQPGSPQCVGPASLPDGPTANWLCPGEWTNNPDRYAAARVTLATDLGWIPVSTTPTLTSISPASGSVSTVVTLTGTNLNGATVVVDFGSGNPGTITSDSATQIIVDAPAGPTGGGPVDVTVTTANGTSGPVTFTYGTPTTTTLLASPTSATYGASVKLTATVSSAAGTPTGTVDFYDNGASIGTGTLTGSGSATLTVTTLPVGTDSITATYAAQGSFAGSSTLTATQVIISTAATATALTASTTSATYWTPITLTATVTVTPGGAAVASPGVNVTFYNKGVSIGTAPLNSNGVATLTTQSLPIGADNLTVSYPAQGNYGASTSPTVTVNIAAGAPPVVTGLSVNYGPTGGGTYVVITGTGFVGGGSPPITVQFCAPGGGSCTVQYFDGVYSGGTVVAVDTYPHAAGQVVVTVTTPNGTSSSVMNSANMFTFGATWTKTSLAASPMSAPPGTPVKLTATVTSGNGAGTPPSGGTVNFYDGTTLIGSGTLQSNDTATFTTSTLPSGNDNLTATYLATTGYVTSTSNVVTVSIQVPLPPGSLAIDTGSPVPVGSFVADTDNNGVGYEANTTTPITIPAGMINPAPAAVYQTNRWQWATQTPITYTIPGLTAGNTYTVRLHFAETYFTQIGQREFNVSINGAQVLTNFDIIAAAGGPNTAVVEPFLATPNASGQIVISFTGGAANNPQINGIEIIAANVMPPPPPPGTLPGMAIDAGGPAVGNFVADTDFSGGNIASTTNAINTSGVTNPAPQMVYQTNRWAPSTYTIPNLTPNASYTVRLHFAETYWTQVGQREFNVSINAIPVLTNFDIIKAAGGPDTAVVETFTATSNPYGQLVISFTTGAVDSPQINGIEVLPAATTTTLTATPDPQTTGLNVVLTATVAETTGGAAVPSGTVNFYNGTTLIGPGTVNSSGIATLTTTILPVGNDSLMATYVGNINYATSSGSTTETITAPAATATTLAVTPSPSATYGTSVKLTATVTSGGSPVTSGTVNFYNGSTLLGTGTLTGSGSATLSTTTLPVGTDSLTASYAAQGNYGASSSSPAVTETIISAAAPTTTSLTASPTKASYGASVTLTAQVLANGTGATSGTVTFFDNGSPIGNAAVTGGVASLSTKTLPMGGNTLTASYAANNSYGASTSSAVTVTITADVTTTTLIANPTSVVYGSSVTLTATVTSGGGTPTGTVNFYNGATLLGTGTLNGSGSASLSTTTLPMGSNTLTASYGGAATNGASTSAATTVMVTGLTTATTLVATPTSTGSGGNVTMTATVTGSGGGTVMGGTVTFTDNGIYVGVGTVSNGVASLSTPNLPVGTDSLTASYAPPTSGAGSNYGVSASAPVSVTIAPTPAGASFTLKENPTTVTIVRPATTGTTTLTLTPINGYSGTVNLSCAGTLPWAASCSFSSTSVTLSGSGSVNVLLTIDTNVAAMQAMPSPFGPGHSPANPSSPLSPILPALAFWWPGSMAGLAAFGRKRNLSKARQRMLQLCLLVLMTGALAAGISGCAGGTYGMITPNGTTRPTVVASPAPGSGGTTQTAALTIIVQ